MKAKLLLSFCLTAYTFALLAQTQQGYVKTLGRPNQPGQMLQGVSIRVQGVHNAMVSAADGSFAFTLQGHKEGDAYRLNSVRKQGYELNEPDAVGRSYALSGRVRLAIVMVSTQQLEADRQRIETNAYKAAERNYKQQMTELKQQLKSQTLTTEQYREAIARLQERFECYQGLIDNMAEHYAHTDYDSLDAVSRQINLFIEDGRLEEADSMLRLSFNPLDVLKNNRQALSRIRQAEKQAHDVMSQAQADLQAVLRQQQKDAEYLYHLYTISLARFDNDMARYYIETRAQLDTLNAEWQLDAGEFQDEYLNDFATARTYYDRALAVSQSQQNDLWTARAYNDIGMTDIEARQTEKGISLLEKALQMRRQLLGDDHPLVAIVYNNLGGCMALSGQAHKCLEYYEKALQIRLKAYGEQNENTAKSYSNLGTQHGEMGHYDKAIEYLLKAIEIGLATNGEYTRFMASSYDNIGAIYLRMGEADKALEYNQKALNVRTKLYGLVHEDVAWSYNNLAVTLSSKGGEDNYRQAIDYLSQAIRSYSELRGENNLFIANCQQNQASLNYKRGKYELSAHQFLHSIVVYTKAEDSTYIDIALSYEGLAKVYGMQDKLDKKRDALSKAAAVYEANGESYRLKAAKLYSQVASMYGNKGMDEQKTAYTQKVITLLTGYTTEDRQEQAFVH